MKQQLQPLGSAEYWDESAKEYVNGKQSENWLKQYIKAMYLKIVYDTTNPNWKILKVDLWNEGVEKTRSILSHLPNDSTGFDISKQTCMKAKRNITQDVAQASCLDLPYRTGYFDAVLDLSTIDHISLQFAPKIFSEYYRILKQNGVLSVVFWQHNFPTKFILHRISDQLYFDHKTMQSLLEKAGFKVQRAFNIGSLMTINDSSKPINFVFWQVKKVLEKKLIDLSLELEFSLPNVLGGLRVIYASKP